MAIIHYALLMKLAKMKAKLIARRSLYCGMYHPDLLQDGFRQISGA